jgi:hypothetical protein
VGIEWVRDLSISVFGFTATLVAIFLALVAYYTYREVRQVKAVVKTTSEKIGETADSVKDTVDTVREEVIKPVLSLSSLVQGVRAGIEQVAKMCKGRDEDGGGKNV